MRIKPFCLLLFYLYLNNFVLLAQTDDMKSDIGVTRGRDKHLWPIFFRETTEEYKKIEAAANLYMYYRYFTDSAFYTHTLPLYIRDSSKIGTQLKIGTSFYPSLFAYQNNYLNQVQSYRFLELVPHINALEYAHSPNGDYLKNNLLFFLWYKNDKLNINSHLILFPIYWNFKNTDTKTEVIFPIYFNQSEKHSNYSNKLKAYTPFIWLNQTNSLNKKEKKLRILPLFHQEEILKIDTLKDSLSKLSYDKNFQLYPLVWRSIQEELSHQNARQIFNTQNKLTYLHDSLNSKKTSNKDLFIFPVFGIHNKRSNELHEFKNHFAPFYFYNASQLKSKYENYREVNIGITPLIWHYKNNSVLYKISVENKIASIQKSNATQTKKNWFIPIFFSKTKHNTYYNKHDSFSYIEKRALALPIFWKTSYTKIDSSGKTTYNSHVGLLPFGAKGYKKSNNLSYFAISPLYWNFTKPNSTFSMLVPSYFHSHKKSYSSSNSSYFLLPVWHHRFATDTLRGTQINKIEIIRSSTLFPLYHKTTLTYQYPDSVKQVYYLNAVTPLLWRLKKVGTNIQSIFPLYWNVKVNNDQYSKQSKWFIPIFYSYYKQEKKDTKNNYSITKNKLIFPFYNNYFHQTYYADSLHFSQSSLLVFPWYFKNKINETQRTQTAFTPFIWYSKTAQIKSFRIIPVFLVKKINNAYQQQFNVKVWPIYTYHTNKTFSGKDTNTLTDHSLFPLYFHIREKSYPTSDKPYFKNQFILFPLYLNYAETKLGSDRSLRGITPLFWRSKDSNKDNTLLLPLYYGLNQNNYKSKTLFPVFSYGKSSLNSKEKHLVITPLFWHINNVDYTSTLLLPLFIHTRNKWSGVKNLNLGLWLYNRTYNDSFYQSNVLWPLTGWGKSREGKNFHLTPLVWYKKSDSLSYRVVFPVYYYYQNNYYASLHIAWPLYRELEVFNMYKKKSFLAGLYKKTKYSNGDYESRVCHLLYVNSEIEGRKLKVLFPFYYVHNYANGGYSKSYAFAFYNQLKKKIPDTDEFYKELRFFWFIRYKSNYDYLKAKGIKFDRKKLK